MLPELQKDFVERVFTQKKYDDLLLRLNERIGMEIEFRVCEMPIFVSPDFRKELERAAVNLIRQTATDDFKAKTEASLEDQYRVRSETHHTMFGVVDFAVTKNEAGDFEPKLIELQGFPSLFGYQFVLGQMLCEHWGYESLGYTFSHCGDGEYVSIMKRALLGGHSPEECCLLEFDPDQQKTRPDFLATEKLFGISPTDIRHVEVVGDQLFHRRNGERTQIKRIYNRAIVDELTAEGVEIPFEWNQPLDVEWAGHPNWYFRVSKYALPHLQDRTVPRSHYLDQLDDIPKDLSQFVLKPLFSFAGKGVIINPTEADITAIPRADRSKYLLMEKVQYCKCIHTPHGMNKAEIRVMVVWLDEWDEPRPMISLTRTGRAELMGARQNVLPWTGATGCLFG